MVVDQVVSTPPGPARQRVPLFMVGFDLDDRKISGLAVGRTHIDDISDSDVAGALATGGVTTGAASDSASTAAAGPRIAVEVTLAPELADKVNGDETLFVFARASEGPRIPLAVVRSTASALPFSTTLDDSQAMRPGMNISSVPQVVIGARITRGGEPTASTGDLQGFSGVITPGADGVVRVTIDAVVP